MSEKPPKILDSAQVLFYAILDSSVIYTGKAPIYYNGKLVGPVPRLAICGTYEPDILLFYCNDNWEVLATGGHPSIESAQQHAETQYQGVSKKWKAV